MPDDNTEAVEHFRHHMSQVHRQSPISERDFLYLCKEAVDLVKLEWQDRDIIASRITTIWLHHSNELSGKAKSIGGLFADLDLPDDHIPTKNKTIRELWNELDYAIMYAIDKLEASHN